MVVVGPIHLGGLLTGPTAIVVLGLHCDTTIVMNIYFFFESAL